MGKAPQQDPKHPSTTVLPAWQMEKCILRELQVVSPACLQSMFKQPIVTATKDDFGELQTEGYRTSLPDACITNILDRSGLNPLYLTQSQLGDCKFFLLTHLGYKPRWRISSTSDSLLSDPASASSELVNQTCKTMSHTVPEEPAVPHSASALNATMTTMPVNWTA